VKRAFGFVAGLGVFYALHRLRRRSGVSDAEVVAQLPGDELEPRVRRGADPGGRVPVSPRGRLGAFALSAALGLLVVSGAFALSRSGRPYGDLVLWIGIVAIVVPAAARLASRQPTRGERIGLVVTTGLALYLVKVAHDPFMFVSADEPVHAFNAGEIIRTESLFATNSILSVTPHYPGLAEVTAAVSSLSGLSIFASGLIVVGAARLVLVVALFLVFEAVSGSARIAGLAGMLYMANPNFLFFSAQLAYESLALPLFVVAVFTSIRWMRSGSRPERLSWAAATAALVAATAMTHHMTSYVLVVTLLLTGILDAIVAPHHRRFARFFPAALACGITVSWLVFVASDTIGYLTPVFTRAFEQAVNTFSAETAPRRPFMSKGGTTQPLPYRSIAFASAALVAVGLPFGLRLLWRRYRASALPLAFGLAAVSYVGALGLRLIPGAWEIGSRASEFLFIGTSFVLALAVVEVVDGRLLRQGGRLVLPLLVAILFAGGAVTGRPSDLLLPRPVAVAADGAVIEPEGVAAANWTLQHLGPGKRIGADASNSRLLLSRAYAFVLAGPSPDIRDILLVPQLRPWQVRVLRDYRIDYLVVDRRKQSRDPLRGYAFCEAGRQPCEIYARNSYEKYNRVPGASKLFGSGNIAIYDVEGLSHASQR
jgi:hypothetical protein